MSLFYVQNLASWICSETWSVNPVRLILDSAWSLCYTDLLHRFVVSLASTYFVPTALVQNFLISSLNH